MKGPSVLLILGMLLTADAGMSQEWEQVASSGFGNPYNKNPWTMLESEGSLFVGTFNWETGAEVWRSDDGRRWLRAIAGGFGDPRNQGVSSMATFNESLFAGTSNPEAGAEIWYSTNGRDFIPSMSRGFGDRNNSSVTSMTAFKGHLYAGTRNLLGAEVWRSSDGASWRQISSRGFGKTSNEQARSMAVHQSFLYVGTANSSSGAELWRTSDGENWSQVVADITEPNNTAIASIVVRDWDLFLGTVNEAVGGGVWKGSTSWNGELEWWQVNSGGFGFQDNTRVNTLALESWRLYAGTSNDVSGAEIWRESLDWPTGEWEESMVGGFGSETNLDVTSMASFDQHMFAASFNPNGAQLWSLPMRSPCPRLLSVLSSPTSAVEVAVSGSYAVLAAGAGGLRVIDVGDRRRPTEVGFLDTPGFASDVVVQRSHAFVADESSLRVVDLSDPARPTESDFLLSEGARGVSAAGPYVYVVVSAGLQVVDVTDPTNIVEVGLAPKPPTVPLWRGRKAAYFGGAVYVAAMEGGLTVFDVSSPLNPRVAGEIPANEFNGESFLDVAASAENLYVGLGAGWHPYGVVSMYDVSAPLDPHHLASLGTRGIVHGLGALEGTLYVSTEGGWIFPDSGVRVMDVSDPTAANSMGQYRVSNCRGSDIEAGVGYVACREGLAIFEHSPCWGWDVMSDGFESGDCAAWAWEQPQP